MFLIVSDNCDVYSLTAKQLEYIPKIILLREFKYYIDQLWDRLPDHIKADSEIQTTKEKNENTPTLGNNCVSFMFDEIRYELNGTKIERSRNIGMTDVYFNFCVPPSMLLGFCENYRRVIINARHELILIVISVLQTDRKNNMKAHKIFFDNCKLTNVKLYLYSEFYSYDDLNLDFDKRRVVILYDMFAHFPMSYYQIPHERSETLYHVNGFLNGVTLTIIDRSRQNESIKSGIMDVRLEFEFKENIPANTTAYCPIIRDCVIKYSRILNVVRKIT
ncbi:hypothetical protein ALC57_18696 [Trachymyrmex cornetzi]|uniref:Double jelly roll-like domain-containing protein n=1 Tax=Trachymyrmex cornetzi TaxID=471704 RepID=A0A151IRA1_9HYME|nr:hypothetical protein ALC57_18696 [Trachymyrmex cornetzi]